MSLTIDFSGIRKKINKVYHPLFEFSNKYRYNVLWGGSGSGKSFAIAEKILTRIVKERDHTILVIRKNYTGHAHTTYETLKDAIRSFGLNSYAQYRYSPLEIRFPEFNSKIIFLGVDDPEKLKGLGAVTSIWIDEITELEPGDFSELEDRLRHRSKFNQIYITFNPVSEHHWIKKRFFDLVDHRALIIHSTYLDNLRYLPASQIEQRKMQAITDPAQYRIKTLGQWGVTDRDNLYYHRFDDQKHVAEGEYDLDKELGVMAALDFNVTPHITGLLIQVRDKTVYVQDELALKSPRNNTEDLAKAVADKIDWYQDQVTVYGDASGRNRSTLTAEGVNNYTIFNSELIRRGHRVETSVDSSNPSLSLRQIFINNVLAGVTDIQVVINPKCTNLIADLLNQKMTMQNGKVGISKQKVRNKQTGETYERYGHSGDAFCYFMTRYFSQDYARLKHGMNIPTVQVKQLSRSKFLY
jgi:phage terminase large subunit